MNPTLSEADAVRCTAAAGSGSPDPASTGAAADVAGDAPSQAIVIQDMLRWLEKAVIGLNLCPFAKAVHVKRQIRYVVSPAREAQGVLQDLRRELQCLAEADPAQTDTTLLILPHALHDFLQFNALLEGASSCVDDLGLLGSIQIASFHPDFCFADAMADDVSNCTNRAPYPCLHLLRESSIDRALEAFPDAAEIYQRNIERLQQLGWDGWTELALGATPHESPST